MRSKTSDQSPGVSAGTASWWDTTDCPRDRVSQRQQHTDGNGTHTGTPSAPARWAGDVSTLMTRSRFFMTAAVSLKSSQVLPRSTMGNRPASLDLLGAEALLQADEPHAGHAGERLELRQRNGTAPIGAFEIGIPGLGISLPHDAHLEILRTAPAREPGLFSQRRHRREDTEFGRVWSRASSSGFPAAT